jgi:hypothetical protein
MEHGLAEFIPLNRFLRAELCYGAQGYLPNVLVSPFFSASMVCYAPLDGKVFVNCLDNLEYKMLFVTLAESEWFTRNIRVPQLRIQY